MGLLLAVLTVLVAILIVFLLIKLVEWVCREAGFPLPADIMRIVYLIGVVIAFIYLVSLLAGLVPLPVARWPR